MVDSTADVDLSSTVESSLHNDIQALLKEMYNRRSFQKGKLRWTVEKKMEMEPSCSISLIKVLVKELEKKLKRITKIHKTRSYMHIVPLLHTLYYVVIQSGSMIPTSLYQNMYECLMKLLTLPLPYSAVVLSTLGSIRMEMHTPGSLYQRRVIAEQNLKNEHFTMHEKVFVLADPAVFSAPLETTVRAYLEVSSMFWDTSTVEKNLVLHVLQKGLGTACQSSRLAQALEALGDQMVEKYFQNVVAAMEQSIKHGASGCAAYMNRLQQIYRDILTACKEEITTVDDWSMCSTAMPFPEINFHLWKEEDDLWNLLANFTLHSSSNSGFDEGEKDKRDLSEDNKIRDLKESEAYDTKQPPVIPPVPAIPRRNAVRNMRSVLSLSLMEDKIEAFPGRSPVLKEDGKRLTARVVVMGDDRVLGKLSSAYHSIRERESKRLILSKKLNLQLYYIPVMDVESSHTPPDSPCQGEGRFSLAHLLGRVDPWYDGNINSLGAAISKLPAMQSTHSQSSAQNIFLLDTLCYYLRCGTEPVNLPLYSAKMTCSSGDVPSVVEEVFVSHLEAEIPEFKHLKLKEPSAQKPQKTTVEVFGAVITVSYTATSLSKREVAKGRAPMTCGVVITSEPSAVMTGEGCLTVRFDSVNPGYNTEIQTQNISIRTMENRTLSVCLDKDSRRIYTDVQRIEVSPCLDPGCSIRSRFSIRNERELPFSKYLNKVLSLPINTFSGATL